MKYHMAMKRNEALLLPTKWTDLENGLHERSQSQKITWFHLCEMSRIDRSMETEINQWLPRVGGEEEEMGEMQSESIGMEFLLKVMKIL